MEPPSTGAAKLVGGAAIGLAFTGMLWWTWGTWPDVTVDFGRELYVPWQLSQGKVLYRDLAWLSGPLAPYVNATWFHLFGVGLRSLVFGNVLLVVALLWLIFRFASTVGSPPSGTMAVLTFIGMFGFTMSNYNFLSPYSHDLTQGALWSFVSLACFAAHLRSGSGRTIGGTGFALGLVFLTKAEVFLALAVALLVGFSAAIWINAIPRGRRRRALQVLIAAALAPCALTWILFSTAMSVGDAGIATAGAWHYVLNKNAASLVFYQRMAGFVDPIGSLRAMAISAVVMVILFAAGVAAAVVAARKASDRILWMAMSFASGVLVVVAAARLVPLTGAARSLPVFMLALGFLMGRGIPRRDPLIALNAQVRVMRLSWVAFALALLVRMFLNVSFYGYGFVLALPATIVLVVALTDWIPARLSDLGYAGAVFRALSLGAWLVLMAAHLGGASANLAGKTESVGSGPDRFLADARAIPVNAAVREISTRLTVGETLLVLPEGVMLNYLSRRASPTPYVNFMPPELAVFGEARIVAALDRQPPDYVAIVHKDTSEYGFHFFGRDYGQTLQAWVSSRYAAIQTWGDVPLQSERFGITLLGRSGRFQGR